MPPASLWCQWGTFTYNLPLPLLAPKNVKIRYLTFLLAIFCAANAAPSLNFVVILVDDWVS